MEKKTIYLELPCEMIDLIDRQNSMGDRSLFITDLLEKQLKGKVSTMNLSNDDLCNGDETREDPLGPSGEINLVNQQGISLGKFNINTIEGFDSLARKISEISEDHIVKMKAGRWKEI